MSIKETPSKEDVIAARTAAGLTQTEAAKLARLSSFVRWSEYERGLRNIEGSRFELFMIKTNQHPDYGPRYYADAAQVSQQERGPDIASQTTRANETTPGAPSQETSGT